MNKRKRSFKPLKIILLIIAAVILILTACLVAMSLSPLEVTRYSIESDKITSPVKIALMADLHDDEIGKDNTLLISTLTEEKPDIILLCGDMILLTKDNHEAAYSAITQFAEIAPTYYSMGNHEWDIYTRTDLTDRIAECGAVFLNDEYEIVSVGENRIKLCGYSDYYANPLTRKTHVLYKFLAGDEYKILMCHMPEYYVNWFAGYDFELTVSGHVHGGQIRLPYLGGVYGPNQGLFPEYDKGLYNFSDNKLIVTAGLGNFVWVPRLNNPPELVIIELE